MALLSAWHDRAYLTTHRSSLAAIKIYLDFGFRPCITEKIQEKVWASVSGELGVILEYIDASSQRRAPPATWSMRGSMNAGPSPEE
jgi:hypothetical protein